MEENEKTKLSLFDHLNIITLDKRNLEEEELPSYTPYIINRFVSMVDHYLPVVNQINRYDLPKDVHQKFMCAFLPKRKQFFKYIKEKKEDQSFERECLQKYFECGLNDVDSMIEVMSVDDLEFVVGKYRTMTENNHAHKKRKK
jgi:hypothetical protein